MVFPFFFRTVFIIEVFCFSSCLTRLHTKYHWRWHDLSILSPNIYIPYELVCWVSSGTSLNTGKDALLDVRLGAPEGGHVKPWPYVPGDNPVVVQSLSFVWLFATRWTAAHQASLPFTVSQTLLKLLSIKSVMPSNHLILCYPLLLLSIFLSIRIFYTEMILHTR